MSGYDQASSASSRDRTSPKRFRVRQGPRGLVRQEEASIRRVRHAGKQVISARRGTDCPRIACIGMPSKTCSSKCLFYSAILGSH